MRTKQFLVPGALGALLAISATCALADDSNESARAILGGTPFAKATYGVNAVRGSAVLAPQKNGTSTKVTLKVSGLKPGTTHIGHIHGGVCPQLFVGIILHNLEPIVVDDSGEGTSRTNIPGNLQGLADCSWWVAIHEGPENALPQTPAVAVGPVITSNKED